MDIFTVLVTKWFAEKAQAHTVEAFAEAVADVVAPDLLQRDFSDMPDLVPPDVHFHFDSDAEGVVRLVEVVATAPGCRVNAAQIEKLRDRVQMLRMGRTATYPIQVEVDGASEEIQLRVTKGVAGACRIAVRTCGAVRAKIQQAALEAMATTQPGTPPLPPPDNGPRTG